MRLTAFVLLPIVLAQTAWAAAPNAEREIYGTWAVDTSKLPMPAPARPRSVTITFSEAGAGLLRTRVEVVDPTGALLEADGVTPLDGAATAVTSNFEADVSATRMPARGVLVMQLAKGGSPGSTRIYTVTGDGKTMTETVAAFRPDGQPVVRENAFTRIR